jgi:hypothetical protein
MGLKELKSNLDIAGGFKGAPGQTFTAQSTITGPTVDKATPDPDYHTQKGASDSPFQTKGDGSGDHLVDLLQDKIVRSSNTNLQYDPQQMRGLQPGPPAPGGDQDFDGETGGQGYFHGVANPGKGQGKQIDGKDLHEHLLTDSYNYNHGNATENVGPSPGATGNSEFQDIDGLEGPKFDKGKPSQIHGYPQDLSKAPTELVKNYESTVNPDANHGNSNWPTVPAVSQDLNGINGPNFNNGVSSTLHEDLLVNAYNSTINTDSSYAAGQPGGTWPSINPGAQDLDGGLPSNGEYINSLPS